MKLYVKCTTDEYELPEVVADSTTELARKTGKSPGAIAVMISRGYPGYHRIEISEDCN